MKKEFISSRECGSCGASIAAYLQRCPYCETIQPAEDLLPEYAYRKVEERLLSIEREYYKLSWSRSQELSYYFALSRIALVPILISLIVFFVFKSWILALILIVTTGIISYIRYNPAYHYYYLSYRTEKELFKKKHRGELDELMKEYNTQPTAYQDIVFDIMENKEYGEFSPILVILDPVDE